jgi:hypothetical protein
MYYVLRSTIIAENLNLLMMMQNTNLYILWKELGGSFHEKDILWVKLLVREQVEKLTREGNVVYGSYNYNFISFFREGWCEWTHVYVLEYDLAKI